MKNLLLASLFCSPLFLTACASVERSPASEPPDSQSVELAHLMKDRSIKFRAFREGNQASVLAFLEVKFRDCEAKVAADNQGHRFDVDYKGSFVECNVDVDSDPVKTRVRAAVQGDKRKFNVALFAEEINKFNLDARMNLEWRADDRDPGKKRWFGKGKVSGWLNQKISNGTFLTVTVRENLDF